MGNFDSPWIKYWLRGNPFFTEALEITQFDDENEKKMSSLFVGRERERIQLTNLIRIGGGTRFLVIGNSGVGKTTLVNYVRGEAKKENYLTPIKEIGVSTDPVPYKIMIETIVLLHDEIKAKEITLSPELDKKLNHLQPLLDINDYESDHDSLIYNTPTKLIALFKELTRDLKKLGFPPIILHYNNFDMIKDDEVLTKFLQNMREFFDNSNAIIILLGDNLLDYCVAKEDRLRQKYQKPVYVEKLRVEEVKEILSKRINLLKIDRTRNYELYDEKVIDTLYKLFDGNIREIITSLCFAFEQTIKYNTAVKITLSKIRDILTKGVQDIFLNKLTPLQKTILKEMMKLQKFTGGQIAEITKRPPQNFSQGFLPKLMDTKVIQLVEIKGREKYYSVRPEIYWWTLEKSQDERLEEKKENITKIQEAQRSLKDF